MAVSQNKKRDKLTSDMAGPETNRLNLNYKVPLPVEGAAVYFGGGEYAEQHPHGFNHEETLYAQQLARHSFSSAEVGEGRVQNWEEGVPVRNQQGFTDELDGISTSAIISDPTLGRRYRRKKLLKVVLGRER